MKNTPICILQRCQSNSWRKLLLLNFGPMLLIVYHITIANRTESIDYESFAWMWKFWSSNNFRYSVWGRTYFLACSSKLFLEQQVLPECYPHTAWYPVTEDNWWRSYLKLVLLKHWVAFNWVMFKTKRRSKMSCFL